MKTEEMFQAQVKREREPLLAHSLALNLRPRAPCDICNLTQCNCKNRDTSSFNLQMQMQLPHAQIEMEKILYNPSPALLYECALQEKGTQITSSGALVTRSGLKTGRSPSDKRILDEPSTSDDVWWGDVNIKCTDLTYLMNRERALDYLNAQETLYCIDGFAGWDPKYRMKIRVLCARAYHALFMRNMLVRPTAEERESFGSPDFVIYNAGQFPANRFAEGMTSGTSVSLSLGRREMVILGTEYAGEMKKGVFTVMHYFMPKCGVLSLHSSCNMGEKGDVSLFFGLSGTGKTTLSADPQRKLIGDDEHVWTDDNVFNIEGGCYAKTVDLSAEKEPEIYNAIRFGALLENVVLDPILREVDYTDTSITENTRCCYPIEFIPNSHIPCIAPHPRNIILLCCDAFGVLPPVAKLNPAQVQYHFINGYTAKIAGTEQGIKSPQATFSACFGEPFLIFHPAKYASMLSEKLQTHNCNAWLVNTGWSGGAYGEGKRMSLKYTRAIIDAIHDGSLEKGDFDQLPVFGLQIPTECAGVPSILLNPRNTWKDVDAYDDTLKRLATLFDRNFAKYRSEASEEVIAAGPSL